MGVDTKIKINGINFKNPVIPASGTFNFGREISELYDVSILGGMVSKGITLSPRKGNPPIRISETNSGMLNSVGLQNPGIKVFLKDEANNFTSYGCVSIVNIAGSSIDEYIEIAQMLEGTKIDIIELNLSCPNVKEGCMAFGSDPKAVSRVVEDVRKVTSKPLWAKLTPNTSNISSAAIAAEEAGADAVSLINTVLGLSVDISSRRPVIRNNYAGLSGPTIKPIALRMVSEVYNSVDIPVIGMGGIASAEDVIEFMMAGATAVQIGTANLIDPYACRDIIAKMPDTMQKYGFASCEEITGSLKLWEA